MFLSCEKQETGCGDFRNKQTNQLTQPPDSLLPKIDFDTEFTQHISNFKVGSYWVYEERKTKAIDSIVLMYNNFNYKSVCKNACGINDYREQRGKVVLLSSKDQFLIDYYTFYQNSSACMVTRNRGNTKQTFDLILQCCDPDYEKIAYNFLNHTYESAYKSYTSPCKYNGEYLDSCHLTFETYYFIKGLGLVHKNRDNGKELWDLVRYQILK